MRQSEVTPSVVLLARPSCPTCGTRMMLTPDHDQRTFDCPKCGNETTEIVKFK